MKIQEKEATAPLPFHQAMLRMEKDGHFEEHLFQKEESLSECSSGSQSGWTLYLCQSQDMDGDSSVHGEEEVDLSMLSDASSGPPRLPGDDCIDFYCSSGGVDDWTLASFAENGGKRRRVEEQQQKQNYRLQEEHSTLLDDTASSPLLCFSKTASSNSSCKKLQPEDVLELSCGFSATHFKGKAAMKKHLDNTAPLNPASICRQEGQRKTL